MQWSDLPLKPSTHTLRQFAGLWLLFMSGVAVWQYVAHARSGLALVFGVLALSIGPAGLAFPKIVRPLFVTWLVLAFPIGWAVSRIVLMVLFWGMITPIAAIMRLSGRDILKLRRRDATTYWTLKERPGGVASYFRQY